MMRSRVPFFCVDDEAQFCRSLIGSIVGTLMLASRLTAGDEFKNARIELIGGSSIRATIDAIKPDGTVIGENLPARLVLDQMLVVKSNREIATVDPNSPHLLLAHDGRIQCREISLDNETVRYQAAVGPQQLPLETIRAIIWSTSTRVTEALENPSTDQDAFVVRTEDGEQTIEGVLKGIDSTHVELEYKGESKKLSLAKVLAIVAANLDLDQPAGTLTTLKLVNGSTIVGAFQSLDLGIFRIKLTGGHELALEAKDIADFVLKSDRVAYLSDLKPIDFQQRPMFTLSRTWQRDRSIDGNPLTFRFSNSNKKISFDKGIGTHSFSSLVFENGGQFDRFRAVVGIDAETDGRGDCQMIVQGDGIELWSKRVRGTDDPESISVDITGMNNVALIVQPGEQFDLGDHANWSDARFTKSK